MNDAIFVTGLLIHAHHGVMEHESRVGQRFILDLVLSIDLGDAAGSDKLADTASYAAIVECATRAFTARNHKLVESAAGAVAEAVLSDFAKVTAVRVTVHKPHAPIAATFADVGVTIVRSRDGHDSGHA
ncbi:MAG: dihydroneopterin aldolase [Xanthobacteraceae bacterium]